LSFTGNFRLDIYCRTQNKTLEELKERDGTLCYFNYVQWNKARIIDYSKVNPEGFTCGTLTDHAGYDAWLHKEFS